LLLGLDLLGLNGMPRIALGRDVTINITVNDQNGDPVNDHGTAQPYDDNSGNGATGSSGPISSTGKATVSAHVKEGQTTALITARTWLGKVGAKYSEDIPGSNKTFYYQNWNVQDGKGTATKQANGTWSGTIKVGATHEVKTPVCKDDPSAVSLTTTSFKNGVLSCGLVGTAFDARNAPATRPFVDLGGYLDGSFATSNADHKGETAIGAIFDVSPVSLLSIDPSHDKARFSDGMLTVRDPSDPATVWASGTITDIRAIRGNGFGNMSGTLSWQSSSSPSPLLEQLIASAPNNTNFGFDGGILNSTGFFTADGQSDGVTTCFSSPTPEPSSFALLATGLVAVVGITKWRKQREPAPVERGGLDLVT
jgi:hypothetical protein